MTSVWTRLNTWVTGFASTNWKIFTGMVMAIATMLFYFATEIRCRYVEGCRPIDSTNFGLWLTFVAAWAGLTYMQFAKKRDTYAAPSPDSERAGVPAEPAPSEPTPAKPPTEAP